MLREPSAFVIVFVDRRLFCNPRTGFGGPVGTDVCLAARRVRVRFLGFGFIFMTIAGPRWSCDARDDNELHSDDAAPNGSVNGHLPSGNQAQAWAFQHVTSLQGPNQIHDFAWVNL